MSTGLIVARSIFAVENESTEGTYVAPSGTTSYLQCLEGAGIKPSREIIDRGLLTSSPGKETPRMGIKSVSAQVPVELRASGIEGGETDFDYLLRSALGARRQNTADVTTRSGSNTSTVLLIEDADIAKFAVGDIVLVKETGHYEMRPIVAKSTGTGSATITLAFALTNGAPSNGVHLSKFSTYYTADTGHLPLSFSHYIANEIRQSAVGCKVTSMALEGFQAGKVASLKFGLEGLAYGAESNGTAPHTPSYDAGLPPIILNACVWRNGVLTPINSLTLSLANELGFLTDTCSANGKSGSRVKSREITGTINPYKDDASTDFFEDWDEGTEFSLFAYCYNPSGTAGQGALGSYVGVWLPQCFTTEFESVDNDGIYVDQMSFRATRGSLGTSEEMYLGFV